MQTYTTEKELRYRTLVTEVREAYLSGSRELQWHEDCKEINLWTYWQGRGHLNADIMLIGQDCGCPRDEASAETIQNVRNLNRNIPANYLQGNHSITDKNLLPLFQTIGFEIQADDPRLFFHKSCNGVSVKRNKRRLQTGLGNCGCAVFSQTGRNHTAAHSAVSGKRNISAHASRIQRSHTVRSATLQRIS